MKGGSYHRSVELSDASFGAVPTVISSELIAMRMLPILTVVGLAASASAQPGFALTTVEFDTIGLNSVGPALVNGQQIVGLEFLVGGSPFFITSATNSTLAIFDTSKPGPNASGGDPDLLVNRGNALIIQNTGAAFQTQTIPGVFDRPDDSANGGNITFNFIGAFEIATVDLIDINGGAAVTFTFTDHLGLRAVIEIEERFTAEATTVSAGQDGIETVDVRALLGGGAPQLGERGIGSAFLASADAGFRPDLVTVFSVDFSGSAALGGFSFVIIPAPSAAVLIGAAGAGLMGGRRRR